MSETTAPVIPALAENLLPLQPDKTIRDLVEPNQADAEATSADIINNSNGDMETRENTIDAAEQAYKKQRRQMWDTIQERFSKMTEMELHAEFPDKGMSD
jgi:phenylalanine-4-hydroxylase